MHIDTVPNRSSPPAVLLRESFRRDGKTRKRTLANLSKLPRDVVEGLRALLRGGTAVENPEEAFRVVRSRPHGHVAAALGTLRGIGLDRIIDPKPSRERDRVLALIVARILSPGSKLATARGLVAGTVRDTLGETLGVERDTEDATCTRPWTGCLSTGTRSRGVWRSVTSGTACRCRAT